MQANQGVIRRSFTPLRGVMQVNCSEWSRQRKNRNTRGRWQISQMRLDTVIGAICGCRFLPGARGCCRMPVHQSRYVGYQAVRVGVLGYASRQHHQNVGLRA